jgi:very-short-patch-repair endonuclease
VAGFYYHAGRLIVELDGDTHVGQEAADGERTRNLEACGYKVIRFWNPDVYDDLEMVLDTIFEECQGRLRPNRAGGQ